nr:3'(2'),5'-bisphosphate nucleotidase CysQ [Aquibacillus sediminis]
MSNVNFIELLQVSLKAGQEILDVYAQDFDVAFKEDDSPLTEADQRADQAIRTGLQAISADIPILSEEGRDIPYAERQDWDRFWLVDPLDGTKEFVKKNGEFTVNIALIEGNFPLMGAIYAPVLDVFYFGKVGDGAYKLEQASKVSITSEAQLKDKSIRLPEKASSSAVNIVASRSHMSNDTEAFIDRIKQKHEKVEVVSAGSSLKFCLVAEGKATYYPRFAPTMEWDTGAGQAIVEASGGKVTRHDDGERFDYNRENLKNGWFLVER